MEICRFGNQHVHEKKSSPNTFLGQMPMCGRVGVESKWERLAIFSSMCKVLCATPSAKSVNIPEHSFVSVGNRVDF
jgi:hypothetical protein